MTQRLAAYLDGQLDADEVSRLEAELVRDPALRAQLDAMRRADDALGTLQPAAPPEGYESRLRARLDRELDRVLAADDDASVTDLASRRRAPWLPALAGAAAVLVLIAVVGLGRPLLRGAEPEVATDATIFETMEAPAGDQAADDAAAEEAVPAGPTVADFDRDLTEGDVGLLIGAATANAGPAWALPAGEAGALSDAFARALGADPARAAGAEPEDFVMAPPVHFVGTASPQTLQDIGPCLETLLDPASPPVPVYVELLVFDGEPAIAYGLVSVGADGQRYDRIEVWVLTRGDCQVRHFAQE